MPQDLSPSESSRLTALESALAHHQRDYEQLNQVVVEQASVIDKLQRHIVHLETVLKNVMAQLPSEQRGPEEEKPPHY